MTLGAGACRAQALPADPLDPAFGDAKYYNAYHAKLNMTQDGHVLASDMLALGDLGNVTAGGGGGGHRRLLSGGSYDGPVGADAYEIFYFDIQGRIWQILLATSFNAFRTLVHRVNWRPVTWSSTSGSP